MKTFSLNKVTMAIGVALLGAFTASHALAQTEEIRNSKLFTESVTSGRMVQIGEPSGNMQPLKGFAKDLPLLTVLKQITPNGWVVKKNDTSANKLDVQKLVSWNGGNSWIETLKDVAVKNNLNVLVNWNSKEITLSPVVAVIKKEEFTIVRPAVSSQKTDIFELAGSESTAIAVGSSQAEQEPVVVAPVVVAPPIPTWTLNASKSLKENVEDWGKAAGYKVVWNGDDYPVDENRGLSGQFDGDTGPVKQLSFDYGPKSRVTQPLAFQFFQNSTLVVDNWKFEQQGFPQFGQ